VALWELLGDSVAGLDWVARLLGAHGRVLPMSVVPLDIEAVMVVDRPAAGAADTHTDGTSLATVRGQVAVATAPGRVVHVGLVPERPPACAEAVAAVRDADWVVLGPGSWFTSVIPHLLVPELAEALCTTTARRVVVLNLSPQPGETADFSPETHLEVLARHAPALRLDAVVADAVAVPEPERLREAAAELGAEVHLGDLARRGTTDQHDPERLAAVFADVFKPTGRPTRDRLDRLPSDRM
jgi:uncharacterized cofD-like protein